VEGVLSRQRLLLGVVLAVVLGLVFDRWKVAQGGVQSGGVEPVDPVQGGQLEVVDAVPWTVAADEFGLVEADQALGLAVVVGVPPARSPKDSPLP